MFPYPSSKSTLAKVFTKIDSKNPSSPCACKLLNEADDYAMGAINEECVADGSDNIPGDVGNIALGIENGNDLLSTIDMHAIEEGGLASYLSGESTCQGCIAKREK